MDVVDLLAELGGTATRSRLGGRVTGDELSRACEAGLVVRVERGRYALPGVAAAPRAALACGGVLCGRSAALQHGWGVAVVPDRPEVTVPQNRRVATTARRGVALHRAWLAPDDVAEVAGVPTTTPERTLADCLRRLPLGEALAVADSALRDGFDAVRLSGIARALRGPGSVQARRTAAAATPLAAGPFESALRAIALDVPLLDVQPQVELWSGGVFLGRPDLVDRALGIVVEADSFGWHGHRAALAHDARRYDELAVAGWLVLRFAYEQVLGDAAWVRSTLWRAALLRSDRLGRAG